MSNLAEQLLESASAVAALGCAGEDIAALDDASVVAGMALVSSHRRNLQAYEVLLSAEIAKRSSHELGNSGLARSNGSATPAALIQSITGGSMDEATQLARLGSAVAEAELAAAANAADIAAAGEPQEGELDDGVPGPTVALAQAALAGEISVAAADAIRRGLGKPDAAITAEQLRTIELELLKDARSVSPEALLKLARIARGNLDVEAVARGQKKRADMRYVRVWQRDGMSFGTWCLPNEDGGAEIHTTIKLALASRTGGPRFPETDAAGEPVIKTAAQVQLEDPRTFDQVQADAFSQIFANGIRVDPSVVPGAGRAPVRVIVTEKALRNEQGTALLEDSLSSITLSKLQEYLCEGGRVGVLFDDNGQLLDVGREQRLFTKRQRTGLGVRDGGCRYPGCDKPPSWCEAHHILQWARDKGPTDVAFGILLCRYHHMLIHDTGSEIILENGTYWLKPGTMLDPTQTLVEMPSRNPIVAAMKLTAAMQVAAVG